MALVVAVCIGPAGADLLDQAENLLEAGKHRQAEIILQNVVLRKPRSFRAHLLLGEARYQQGAYSEAQSALQKARQLKPDDTTAAALLGYTLFAQDNWAEAIPHLQAATEGGEGGVNTWYRLGIAYRETGRLQKAREALYTAAIRNMDHAPTVVALARVEKRLGNHAQSAYWYRRAVKAKPDDRSLFFEMVDALTEAGKHLQAEMALNRHVEENPEDARALLKLAKVYGKLGLSLERREIYRTLEKMGRLDSGQRLELLQAYVDYAAWDDAAALYEKLTEAGVNNSRAHRLGGLAHLARGDSEAAIAAFKSAVELSPQPDNLKLLASAYTAAGRHADALRQYRRLVSADPRKEALRAAADSAVKAGQYAEAVELLMRLAAGDPDDATLRMEIARAAENAGDVRQALIQWTIATRLDDDLVRPHIALSRLAFACGYRARALREFRNLQWNAMTAPELLDAASVAVGLTDPDTALHALRMAWEMPAAEAPVRLDAAGRLLDLGHPVDIEQVSAAWSQAKNPPEAADVYARYLLLESRYEDAVGICKHALAADPLQPELYRILIDASEGAGTPEAATDAITALISSEGINPVAVDFLRVAYRRGWDEETAAEEMVALMRLHPQSEAILSSTARAFEDAGMWLQAAEVHEALARSRPEAGAKAALAHLTADQIPAALAAVATHFPDTPHRDAIAAMIAEGPEDERFAGLAAAVLQIEPGSVEFFTALGHVFIAADAIDRGAAIFETLAREEDITPAHAGAALLLHEKGDDTSALAHIETLSPTERIIPQVAVLEAECHLAAGQYSGALAAAEIVSAASPVMAAQAHEIAGEASLKMQRPREALDHFVTALIFDIDSDSARHGLETLCKSGRVSLRDLRAQFDRLYRNTSGPEVVVGVAEQLAEIEGFGDVSEWAETRQKLLQPDK